MTNVIQFPVGQRAKRSVEPAPVADFNIFELLERPFPAEAYRDADTDELGLNDDSWKWLGALFNMCGLQLPFGASADESKAVWGEIFVLYAPAIRMYAESPDGAQIKWLLDPLDLQQLLYAKAISEGDTLRARRLAASLFNRPNLRQFIVAN